MNISNKFCLLLLVMVLLAHSELAAQWTELNGFKGAVSTISTDGPNLLVGTFGAVFLSTDNGKSWVRENSGLSGNGNVISILASQGFIYVGTDAGGAFRSANNGKDWTAVSSTVFGVCEFAVNPVSGSTIFAGTFNGVFFTTDNGNNWIAIDSGLANTSIMSLVFSGKTLLAGTADGTFRLSDETIVWVPSGLTNKSVRHLTVNPNSSGNVLAVTDSGVFFSSDSGKTWVTANAGLPDQNANTLESNGSLAFAGTNSGVYVSSNNGSNWNSLGLTSEQVYSLSAIGTTVFAGSNDVLYLSTDNGASWNSILTRLSNPNVNSLLVDGNTLFAGTHYDGFESSAGIYLSTDDGIRWNATSLIFAGGGIVNSLMLDSNNHTLFAGGSGLFTSSDGGMYWSTASVPSPPGQVHALAISDSFIFAGLYDEGGGGAGVYGSTDAGQSWMLLNGNFTDVWSLAASRSTLYAGTDHGVLRSYDNGRNWTGNSPGLSNLSVLSICLSGTNVFAGTYGGGIFLSSDSGKSWIAVDSGLTNMEVWSLVNEQSNIFAGTWGGVFLSTNEGASWTNVSTELADTNIYSLTVSDKMIFAGTDGMGVWGRPLSEMITSVKNPNSGLARSFELFQNYPNPFNPSTAISYRLQNDRLVVLKIFDVLGREIETLVNERQSAGIHFVTFHADNLTSGVYFYRLEAGAYHDTKKFLLLK